MPPFSKIPRVSVQGLNSKPVNRLTISRLPAVLLTRKMSCRSRIQLPNAEQNTITDLFKVRETRIELDVDEIEVSATASEISEGVFKDGPCAIEVLACSQFDQLIIASKI